MRSLALVRQEQNVGELGIYRHGTPKMINSEGGILNIQKFKMEVPLATTQEYILNGFDGLIPSITVESEATPVINLPDGQATDLENVLTKRITTESYVRQEDEKTFLTIVCRFIMTAQFTVTNMVSICNVFMAPVDDADEVAPPPATEVDPVREQKILDAKSLIELGNLDDCSDVESDDNDVDMIKENRIPYKTKLHNINQCDGDISHVDETDAELAQQLHPLRIGKQWPTMDSLSDIDSAYGTIDGSLAGSVAISRAISDFESINLDSDTETEDNDLYLEFSDNEDLHLRDLAPTPRKLH